MPAFLASESMSFWQVIFLFAVGLLLIIKGGDWFVDAAVWIAEKSGIPKFIIGATVVSLATTLPELLTSLFATLDNNLSIATGNAVGSVTANIGLIMGTSIICMPSPMKGRQFVIPAVIMSLSTLILLIFSVVDRCIALLPSVLLMMIFVGFMFYNVGVAKKNSSADPLVEIKTDETRLRKGVLFKNIVLLVTGALLIVIGAQFLQTYGKDIAIRMHVPENIIAITIIAIGTSLPELVTTVTAIAKKQADLSIGNIIGANVFDLTLILGVCAFSSGGTLRIGETAADINASIFNVAVCLVIGLLAIIPPVMKRRFYRWQGVALMAAYGLYIGYSCYM